MKKEKKAPLISFVTGKQKSSKKQDLLDHSGTYYVINDCNVRRGISVANLNAKEKVFFFDQQPSKQNTAEQSDKSQQLYIHKNHSYSAYLLICDKGKPKDIKLWKRAGCI